MEVRTRFAPSPTGFLHVGGARTALYSWAFARKHGGKFILRIEDTDLQRSTQESKLAILDGLNWLGIDWDEGPFYQTQQLDRYREYAQRLVVEGNAYYCYASKEDLESMREAQRKCREKPRYDGRWRDTTATPPNGVKPVIRFKNPLSGEVSFDDKIKGPISVQNSELDDLVILRGDGIPTYNFGVVVDDLEMRITHVIRGDDHVNNTPRQINIFRALGKEPPQYAHVPMILGPDGERLSKRHGAVSVMQYHDDGYLSEAMVNYLARLGWSHGDAEIFGVNELIYWFDLAHVSKSPARFNGEKFSWLNQQYIKSKDVYQLAEKLKPLIERAGGNVKQAPELAQAAEFMRNRAKTILELADACMFFYKDTQPDEELQRKHLTGQMKLVLIELRDTFVQLDDWQAVQIGEKIKSALDKHKLPMSKIAVALRVMIFGRTQTPDINVVLALTGKERVLRCMEQYLV